MQDEADRTYAGVRADLTVGDRAPDRSVGGTAQPGVDGMAPTGSERVRRHVHRRPRLSPAADTTHRA
ncbi:hypothetical protein [Streptomyces galilaeus]|uniref:hypothetical protein n=1 Tax=Streptomyces galilaeus TaxID=33899 RepID=UPI0038F79595